jgi:hypothetical protein
MCLNKLNNQYAGGKLPKITFSKPFKNLFRETALLNTRVVCWKAADKNYQLLMKLW